MGTPLSKCTVEFKQKAVELCKKLGCDSGSLADWAKKADAVGLSVDADPF